VKTAVAIPTQRRAAYLDVALTSVAAQARAADAELLVVDDGPDDDTRAVAARHGARYLAHQAPRGLNAARNTALRSTDAELVCFLDDDVRVLPGWLDALVAAAAALPDEVGCLTGPIHAVFEEHRFRTCGREGPPVTHLDLGSDDVDAAHAWGANMAVRGSAVASVGEFAEHHQLYGDEQEWQARLIAAGGRIRYVAAAGIEHRRAGDDARLRALCRAARRRGRAARREDVAKAGPAAGAPTLRAELRTLLGCVAHGPRFACMNGPVMAAHSLGRIDETLRPTAPPATPGVDDFLSGQSGTFGGANGIARGAADALLDVRDRARAARLARAAGHPQRVLVLAVERPGSRFAAARAELERSRHDVTIATSGTNDRGKFANLNALLAEHDLGAYDWLLVVDDDVTLPRHFLDAFLHAAAPYALAQPAHRLRSHAAWPHTRRRARGGPARETTFVEIGPVTAFRRSAFATLLPFPDVQMGWGLDAHWSALVAPLGIVDATPIGHTDRPAADAYSREQAVAEARAFLAGKPYVTREQAR
jgi:GT2 family glycosyltransferase